MKFLCENCKAKYQIADEKVAGRTVRMKCRKCGNMIQVESSVTESSVNSRLPMEGGPSTQASAGSATGAVQAAALGHAPWSAGPPRPGLPMRPLGNPPPAPGGPLRQPAGLAGAFSKSVAEPRDTPPSVSAAMVVLSSSGSAEEWYVGVNGVPVGPVRLSDLRRKAGSGAITEDSLVWREGFEEWVPLRTFPELCLLLKEGSTVYPSLTPPAPSGAGPHPSGRSLVPGSLARSASMVPRAPAVVPALRNNVVPIASRRSSAEKVASFGEPLLEEDVSFESLPPSALVASAVAAPQFGAPSPGSVAGLSDAASSAAASSAYHVPAPAGPASREPSKSLDELRRSRVSRAAGARRSNPALWVVLILAGMLGGVGLDLLVPKLKKSPEVQIVSVMVPAPPVPSPAVAAREEEGTTTVGPIELVAAPTKGGRGAPKAAAPVDPAAAGSAAAPLGPSLTGLSGLVTGPSGPSGGASPGAAGGQLAAADVERVVQSHRAFVKRQCWDNALSTRSSGAPSSARVVVSVAVARDGSVQSVNASGGESYPGLASCVQGNVKGWKFPPSEGATVNVPFVFAAQ